MSLAVPAALGLGFLGSGHCVLMCGGIGCAVSGAGAARAPRPGLALAAHAGRIATYACIGALAGGFGAVLSGGPPGAGRFASVLSATLLVLIGLDVGGWWRVLDGIERRAGRLWRRIGPLTRALVPVRAPRQALALGALWGLVPCGLVYAAAGLALLTGGAAGGAATMLAFGAGTVPALAVASLGAGRLARLTGAGPRRAAGGCLVAAGFVTLLAAPVASFLDGG